MASEKHNARPLVDRTEPNLLEGTFDYGLPPRIRFDGPVIEYIDGRPVELHDLDADPFERDNLLEKEPAIARQLTARLHEFLAAPRDRSGFPEK